MSKTCDECGAENPVVHLTQVINNKMTMLHLCESCASVKGLDTSPGPISPLTAFISQMGSQPAKPSGLQDRCSFCGLSYADFKEVGRLGCPECWTTFRGSLEKLLRRVHGSTNHVGKVYLPPNPTSNEMDRRLEGLRNRLDRAVESEDFERAAKLRDQIRSLETRS